MSVRQEWDAAVRALVLGADRGGSAAEELLAACAALGPARYAARLPEPLGATGLLAPAPPPADAVAGSAARAVLAEVLAVDDHLLLTEWCATAAGARVVASPAELPDLLGLGTTHPGLRPAVLGVLGSRGRWLATTRPGWAWASGGEDVALEDVLDLPSAQRLAALRRARAADAGGVGAFVAAQYWRERRAADREVLIGALATRLSPDDEPVLEAALDDRSAGVHDEAVRLLRALPGSALRERAAERLLRGLVLTPEGFDVRPDELWAEQAPTAEEARDLLRDGSESSVAHRIGGAAASVPTEHWTTRLGVDDARAASELQRGPWSFSLLRGVAGQIRRSADPEPWAMAAALVLNSMPLLELLGLLPGDLAARVVVAMAGEWHYDVVDHACSQLPSPWPPWATAALLDRFAELRDPSWRVGRPPSVLVTRGDAGVLGASRERIEQRWPAHSGELEVLRLRLRLRKSFAEGEEDQ
ncbi:DUF5691 domain-containing protein [Umezawaea beigongshangensis]|uniref:DUF5691 domain-containing protein n=1 Tax=Umezawaea beigongshangensis TaxID=2780383 RepID=UPI0018F24C94|nr:DUF5691 domain-containing protein [Umezawaea beigongshangensis]